MPSQDKEVRHFVDRTVQRLDADIARLVRAYQGDYGYEDRLFVPSPDNLAELDRQLTLLQSQVNQATLSPFWHDHFLSILRGFSFTVAEHRRMPHHYLSGLAGALSRIADLEGEECLTHCRQLSDRLAQVGGVVDQIVPRLQRLSAVAHQELLSTGQSLIKAAEDQLDAPSRLQSYLGSTDGRRFFERLQTAKSATEGLLGQIDGLGAGKASEESAPPFATLLADSLQLELDYLLSWYQDDFNARWQDYVAGAASLGNDDDPSATLNRLSPPYSSADAMLKEGRTILERVREAARSYVRLPEGEQCQVIATPDYLKFCPTAVYMGSNVHEGQLNGKIGLNAENYTAFSRASHWGTMAHEGYPGHHTHFILTGQQRLPETFLLYLPLSRPLVEGVAHRTETLMAPHHEDDVARLATARRVLFCAGRVRAVMELNYHQRPSDEIFDMYHNQLKVNEFTARSQVRAHLRMPGDAVSFYTGSRLLREWEKELGYDPATFTQLICSFGFVAINTMGAILRLNEEERKALLSFRQ